MGKVPIAFPCHRSRDKSAGRLAMITVCTGFLDVCLPIDLERPRFKRGATPKNANQHGINLKQRCEANPVAQSDNIF